jgi:hypothetical protein
MKYLPCILDEVVSEDDREYCYVVEKWHSNPVERDLLSIIDRLAAAYLDVARERDKWKGVCDLAGDEKFWKALEVMKMGEGEDG